MDIGGRLVAGLLASAAPAGACAQDVVAPPAPTPTPAPAPTPTPGPRIEMRGPDGAPLPPDVQRRIEERLKAGAAPGGSDGAPQPRMEFRGPDGKPLPPEIQKQLEERFRADPSLLQRRPEPAPGTDARDVVVTGQRPRGSVIGTIPPERTFTPAEIRAFGANDIGELIQALGPVVSSDRGRDDNGPVVLVNGKRVSSFAEIARIPPEAIERMETFPEELALKYGYRADQKVVNVVLFERYQSRVGQLTYSVPTDGGRDGEGVNASFLRIRGGTRFNFDANYNRSDALLESDRDIVQVAGEPDAGRFRTLLPRTERLGLNGTVSGTILGDVSATLNGRFEATDSTSLLGLGTVGPLARDIDVRTTHLGTALGGTMGKWLWSFTGNYDRINTETLTDVAAAAGGRDRARSINALANAELVLSGAVAELPAGPLSASVRGGVETRDFDARSLRGAVATQTELSRDRGTVQANLDLPIASREQESLAVLGDLSLNANLEAESLSDFGSLYTYGFGALWSPVGAFTLIASTTREEGAPTVEQLGAPLIETPNVRTYDFTRREVVDVARLSGGNLGLRADDRRVTRLGLNLKPWAKTDLTFSLEYLGTRISRPIAVFPIATPEIEAAFPERFTRDASGRLLRIDGRPLNFARSEQEQLRWGINFTRPLGVMPPGMENARIRFGGGAPMSEADLQRRYPGAKIIRAEMGSAAARRVEGAMSRLLVSLYHTWRFEDELLVRDGGPTLDLLDGSAVNGRGGRPRHEVEFQAAAFKRGLGGRMTATWQSGTTVRGLPGAAGAGDLRFSDTALVNVTLFADLANRFGGAKAPKWLKGTRISVGIDNLFNARPDVRDAGGLVPLSYQPSYLDPLGRSVNLSLRKTF